MGIRLVLNGDASPDTDLGNSKFFGSPTVPSAMAEEGFFGEDEAFFFQLKLSDIASLDKDGCLPHSGYLYFMLETEKYPYSVRVVYSKDEPDTVIDGFNDGFDDYYDLTSEYYASFSSCDECGDGVRMLCERGDGEEMPEGEVMLLQYDPLDAGPRFLTEIDGFMYVFIPRDALAKLDFSKAHLVIERS